MWNNANPITMFFMFSSLLKLYLEKFFFLFFVYWDIIPSDEITFFSPLHPKKKKGELWKTWDSGDFDFETYSFDRNSDRNQN